MPSDQATVHTAGVSLSQTLNPCLLLGGAVLSLTLWTLWKGPKREKAILPHRWIMYHAVITAHTGYDPSAVCPSLWTGSFWTIIKGQRSDVCIYILVMQIQWRRAVLEKFDALGKMYLTVCLSALECVYEKFFTLLMKLHKIKSVYFLKMFHRPADVTGLCLS